MSSHHILFTLCAATVVLIGAADVHALSAKECSVKYKEAQKAGTLQGRKWNEFRKVECADASTVDPTVAPATAASPAASTVPNSSSGVSRRGMPLDKPLPASGTQPSAKTPGGTAGSGSAVFPNGIAPKYTSESPGKARMHTCLDQYNANKANNGNGGLNWIQKGGGYYSECNKRLKS